MSTSTGSLSETAQSLVLALKRQALERKNAGDLDAAKKCVAQARAAEALDLEGSAADLKRLALLLKQNGDLPGARQALLQSKRVEQQQRQQQQSEASEEAETPTEDNEPKQQQKPVSKYEDPVNQAMDEANLDELYAAGKGRAGSVVVVKFTDDEMLDVQVMSDMKGSDMAIPTRDEYQSRADACKRAALKAKQAGDIAAAKAHLLKSKQFARAIETLFVDAASGGGGLEGADDGEDYSLLEELMSGGSGRGTQDDDGFFEQLFGKSSTAVELDDLDDLDPSMLRDMMENGMEVPDVDQVLKTAQEKKAVAVQCKKDGDLGAAKAALEEAKRLEYRANQLSEMLQAIESGACDDDNNDVPQDPEAMLEAMLERAKAPPKVKTAAAAAAAAAAPQPEKLLSSQEYKVRAVQCKQEGNMAEALEALRLYKRALALEQSAQLALQRKECVASLLQEAQLATEQCRLFSFYEWFVDQDVGEAQLAAWKAYAQQLSSAAGMAESEENAAEPVPTLERSGSDVLKQIREPDLSFVGKACNRSEERIEVCLMEFTDLQANKHVRKVLGITKDEKIESLPTCDSLRFVATSQLPESMENPDEPVDLQFKAHSQVDENYTFQGSQFLNAERGSSRFAKLIARRLTRKRIHVDVFYVSVKKSLFSKTSEDHLLGTAVVELKDLLQTNWIAGDFPLLDITRRHQVGGSLRIAIRTGGPFAEQEQAKEDAKEEPIAANTGLTSNVAPLYKYNPLKLL